MIVSHVLINWRDWRVTAGEMWMAKILIAFYGAFACPHQDCPLSAHLYCATRELLSINSSVEM